jgi:protein-tyrosine phosphatase
VVNLEWPGCGNARDLGGLPTTDGGVIRSGALLRSDSHGRLTPAGIVAFRAAGVVRIIDLRKPAECAADPSPFAGDPVYRHIPMLEQVLTYEIPHDTYAPMLDHNGPRITAAFDAFAFAPPGPVAVHCVGGRDRTAGLVALALSVAGVPAAEIVADYARSPERAALAMANTLDHLTERYGGAEPYLRRIGVTPPAIEAARRRLAAP